MTTLTVEKWTFDKTNFSTKEELFLYVLETIQDEEDIQTVLHLQENDNGTRFNFDEYLKNV